jgi:hypothetical protein
VLASATDRPAALLHFVQHIDGEELAALRAMLDDLSEDGPEPS